jgi:hypothetical protein
MAKQRDSAEQDMHSACFTRTEVERMVRTGQVVEADGPDTSLRDLGALSVLVGGCMLRAMARKTLRCRFGWHKWVSKSNEDGSRYVGRARCPKVTDDDPGPMGRPIPG